MRYLIFAGMIALSGCAQHMWVKDGAQQSDFERDRAQCLYEVSLATSGDGGRYYRNTGEAAASGLVAGLRQRDLAIMCMEARGYHREPMR